MPHRQPRLSEHWLFANQGFKCVPSDFLVEPKSAERLVRLIQAARLDIGQERLRQLAPLFQLPILLLCPRLTSL